MASYTGKNTEKGAKPMGQKDITEKVLEDYNDVFADIINGLLFGGEQEIKPEDLENTTVHAQYKAEDDKVHELERDIAKYWKEEKVELAICGIENQSTVEKHMPFRIIGYDGSAYRNQLQQERRKMLPVVTIVLYFGTDRHWNSRKKIKELMEIPKCLDRYVNDYQMHVFEVAWLTEEQISHFRSDFKVVANFFVQKRKNRDYIPDDPTEIRHVDEVLKLLQVMTGDRRYEEILVVDLLNSWNNEKDNLYLCIVNDSYDKELLDKIKNAKITVIMLNRKIGGKKTYGMKKLRKFVKRERIDIIHCHSVNVFNYAFLALGYSFKRKYILTIHNVSIYGTLSKSAILIHNLFIHKITAISETVKNSIIANGFLDRKVDIIYNGIDFSKYSSIERNEHKGKVILCVGRMVPAVKGQDTLIKALKYVREVMPDAYCVFAGGNPENHDYIAEMKEIACKEKVDDYITFLGDCHNVPYQMARADILVMPSREEGFGLAAVEGMASGIPVLVTRTGGLQEIVKNGVNGYLTEADQPKQMADKIIKILSTDQSAITKRAYQIAYEKYDISQTADLMRKAYE